MADTKETKAEEMKEREEMATKLTAASTPRPAGVAAVPPARARIGSEPRRLSKGQRKHVRRQKQAHEFNVTDRR